MEIYDRPATAFVAAFVGSPPMNLLPVDDRCSRRAGDVVRLADGTSVRTGIDAAPIPAGTDTETRRAAGSDLARCARRRRHAGPRCEFVERLGDRTLVHVAARHGPEADRGGQRPEPPGRRRHGGTAVRCRADCICSTRRAATTRRSGEAGLTWPCSNVRSERRPRWANLLFVAPYLTVYALLIAYPLVAGFALSLYKADFFGDKVFVGIENYVRLLGDDLFLGTVWQYLLFPAADGAGAGGDRTGAGIGAQPADADGCGSCARCSSRPRCCR